MILKSLEQLGEYWEAEIINKSNRETQYLQSNMIKADLLRYCLGEIWKKIEICVSVSKWFSFNPEIIWSS